MRTSGDKEWAEINDKSIALADQGQNQVSLLVPKSDSARLYFSVPGMPSLAFSSHFYAADINRFTDSTNLSEVFQFFDERICDAGASKD